MCNSSYLQHECAEVRILGEAGSDDKFYDGFTPRTRTVFLRNDDNDFSRLSIEDSAAEEGNSLDFTVTLSPQNTQMVAVEYAITDGTAQEGSDYTASPSSGTLMFTPGETQKTISVHSIDDSINEPEEETLVVTLRNPQNAVLNRDRATGIIKDNDDPDVSAEFASSAYSVTEGETTAVRVTLSADPERTVTIPIVIDQATTAATEDYSLSLTSVAFASGETSKEITLTAADDDLDDDDESVVLGFGTLPEGVSAGERDRVTITILDNDVAESGGGGCAIATETGHGVAAVNLLLIVTVLFSVLLGKTRSTNQPRYCESR